MSLYNMLHGVGGNARIGLAMLDIGPADTGRFRDCWIEPGGKAISVFTRNGGGNRESYEAETERLRGHPCFVKDFDDDWDCTYATYVFKVPDSYKDLAERLSPEEPPPSLAEKTDAAIDAIKDSPPLKDEKPDRIKVLVDAVREAVESEREVATK